MKMVLSIMKYYFIVSHFFVKNLYIYTSILILKKSKDKYQNNNACLWEWD